MLRVLVLAALAFVVTACANPTAPQTVPDCRALLSLIGHEFYVDGRPPTDSIPSCRMGR